MLRAYGIRSVGTLTAGAALVALLAAPAGEAERASSGGAAVTPPGGSLKRAAGPSDPGAPNVYTAVSAKKVYAAGRDVRFSYQVGGSKPAAVVVRVVRTSDGSTLRKWNQGDVAPGDVRTLTWNGKDHGKTPPDDRYGFRLSATSATGATARNARDQDGDHDAFDFHGYVFPLKASHKYGDGFGAPRSGHTHQGQDIFASCGSTIRAPRGGRVKVKKYQSAAGNYVVIDGAETGYDFFFAHLRHPSKLSVGDRVETGEKVGNVGDTGDAVGCHLHFEIWTSPGWYTGGHPIDPEPFLRAWDKYS
jgi:murein DD-endopeptidase MepM/ murein hydrolase activator NlpD